MCTAELNIKEPGKIIRSPITSPMLAPEVRVLIGNFSQRKTMLKTDNNILTTPLK